MEAAPDRQPPVDAEACVRADAALVRAFDLLGRRWTGVLLGTLSGGPAGFRAISRAVDGISDSMLSDRLTELCNVGLATRTVDEGPPISVAYELTRGRPCPAARARTDHPLGRAAPPCNRSGQMNSSALSTERAVVAGD